MVQTFSEVAEELWEDALVPPGVDIDDHMSILIQQEFLRRALDHANSTDSHIHPRDHKYIRTMKIWSFNTDSDMAKFDRFELPKIAFAIGFNCEEIEQVIPQIFDANIAKDIACFAENAIDIYGHQGKTTFRWNSQEIHLEDPDEDDYYHLIDAIPLFQDTYCFPGILRMIDEIVGSNIHFYCDPAMAIDCIDACDNAERAYHLFKELTFCGMIPDDWKICFLRHSMISFQYENWTELWVEHWRKDFCIDIAGEFQASMDSTYLQEKYSKMFDDQIELFYHASQIIGTELTSDLSLLEDNGLFGEKLEQRLEMTSLLKSVAGLKRKMNDGNEENKRRRIQSKM